MKYFVIAIDDDAIAAIDPSSKVTADGCKYVLDEAVKNEGLESYATVHYLDPDILLDRIRAMHADYGDGYHDGTDHAMDHAIEELRKVGYLPMLDKSWVDRVRS